MYKSIADGFKVINRTEGLKGFTLVSICFRSAQPRAQQEIAALLSPQSRRAAKLGGN
jgi:hypothetical protein